MPIDPISWIIIGTLVVVGIAVGLFWDEIKAWATKVAGYILDAVNSAIEVATPVIISLVKKGNYYYRRAEAYIYNIYDEDFRRLYREEEIALNEIPPELLAELDKKDNNKIEVLQQQLIEERIAPDKMPKDIHAELTKKAEIKLRYRLT